MTTSQNSESPEKNSARDPKASDLPSPKFRRELLLEAMKVQEGRGFDCRSCSGECCTSKSNSMKIDAEEAHDIYSHLVASELWTEELIQKLRDCIRDYRLDVEIPTFGSRPNIRRTYTCPFYAEASNGPFGCSLPREVRPLGCLAFNPTREHSRGLADQCTSDIKTFAQQEEQNESTQAPHKPLEKQPIPIALLGCQVLSPDAPPRKI